MVLSRFVIATISMLTMTLSAAGPVLAASWSAPADNVTFNSIKDNPSVGDERNFLGVKIMGSDVYADSVKVQPGQEIAFRLYYDNNGNRSNLVAKNTKVVVSLPTSSATAFTINGAISADNAKPQTVSDKVSITSDKPVKLNYESGSARIWNNIWRGQQLNDSVVTSGSLIGYSKLDGSVQPGAKYSGYVTIRAMVASVPVGGQQSTNGVPNTGPGNVIGTFLAASVLGTFYHLNRTYRRKLV